MEILRKLIICCLLSACCFSVNGSLFPFNVNLKTNVIANNNQSCNNNSPCRCHGRKAICDGIRNKLTYIPRFPKHIRELHFVNNYLPIISSTTFENVTNFTDIEIENNMIESCQDKPFQNVMKIKLLRITKERLIPEELKKCLMGLGKKGFQHLKLTNMDFQGQVLPHNFFQGLDLQIDQLNMFSTTLQEFNMSILQPLPNLEILQLSNCSLTKFTPAFLPLLKWLTLKANNLLTFPSFCSDNTTSVLPRLQSLSLANNAIVSVEQHQLSCLKNLKNLTLTDNNLARIKHNTFSFLPKLYSLYIEHNHNYKVEVEDYAFNSSTLKHLYFTYDYIYLSDIITGFKLKAFKYCHNLEIFFLDGNTLGPYTTEEIYIEVLGDLPNLKKLSISKTRLTTLPSVIPLYMHKLKYLYAHTNFIDTIKPGFFENLTSLRQLDLRENQISIISEITFTTANLKSLKVLNVAWNHFSCTCELVWFIQYIKTHHYKFENYPKGYFCSTPPSLNQVFLSKVPLNDHICLVREMSTIIISVSTTFLFLFFSFSLIYRYRWYLRYFIYLIRFNYKRFERIINSPEYKYDIYFSCDEHDFDYLYENVTLKLEEEMNLKVYIPQRDGKGNKINEIITNMSQSRKAILFFSNSYVCEKYCEFEASIALDCQIHEKRSLIICVVLEELDAVNMTSIIHKILDVDEYIKWGETDESIQMSWRKISSLLNTNDDLMP